MFSVLEGRDGALWTQPSLSKYCGHKMLLLQAWLTLIFPWEFQVLKREFLQSVQWKCVTHFGFYPMNKHWFQNTMYLFQVDWFLRNSMTRKHLVLIALSSFHNYFSVEINNVYKELLVILNKMLIKRSI